MSDMTEIRQPLAGRVNQRNRTREAILGAAAASLRMGSIPSVPEAAAAARVSQATAYRYFPTQSSLLEALIDDEMRSALRALDGALKPTGDPFEDVDSVARIVSGEIIQREAQHRSLLRLALDQWFLTRRDDPAEYPIERGGRIAFIVEALEPLEARLGEASVFLLAQSLSLAIGIESHLVLRDVWGLRERDALEVTRWTCRALITQALADAPSPTSRAGVGAGRKALERSRRRRSEQA